MTKEERTNKILAVSEMASKIHSELYNIVWENQEGQEDHFDNLPKAERVALVGLLSESAGLMTTLGSFKHWFIET